MTKKVLLFAVLILNISVFAQKAQRIGYIDMEYILENLPEYKEAQNQLNAKVAVWQNQIDKEQKEIELLKTELNNERALLTKELIEEKEEDIQIKEIELKKFQETHFGVDGDLFILQQQIVKPIQDMVYNAVQDIASKRRYDLVLNKSSDLIMLYSNDQFDISDQIIKVISRNKKVDDIKAKREAASKKTSLPLNNEEITEDNGKEIEAIEDEAEELKTDAANIVEEKAVSKKEDAKNVATETEEKVEQKTDERAAKKAELKKKLEDKRAAQQKKREELKKAIEAKRQERLKKIEEAKKAKEEKQKNN